MFIPLIEIVCVGYATRLQDDIVHFESPITDDSKIISNA